MKQQTGGVWLGLVLLSCGGASAAVRYVAPAGGGISPFTDWASAATNIQDAVDVSSGGDLIWVTNGTYTGGGRVMDGDLVSRAALNKPATVQSVNGPVATIIQGNWDP